MKPSKTAALFAILALCGALGCRRNKPHGGQATPAVTSTSVSRPPPPSQAPLAGELVEIPEGPVMVGSRPGTPGREPRLEPREQEVTLGSYLIDKLPYPNDPSKPPLTGLTRDEAERRCAERQARLCTELEWERACKGPNNQTYAGSEGWAPECATQPASCASGFDVLAMGTSLREWTSSDVQPKAEGIKRGAAVRGAAATSSADSHRCARRESVAPESSGADLGFRCCKGAPNGAVVPEPELGPAFRKLKLTTARLSELLSSDVATASLAKDLVLFREPDGAETVVSRGHGERQGLSFTVAPLIWSPIAGAEFLLVPGRTGDKTSFVVAFHVLGEDRYSVAASFVMKDEAGPVALAYDDSMRPRVHFSTCWGCPGETGKILYRDPGRVVLLQP